MKLYGVMHGGAVGLAGFELGKFSVEPAPEIIDAISQLPPNSAVGIETIPGGLDGSADLDGFVFHDDDKVYWQELVDATEEHGHSVVYLDSLDLHKAAAKRNHEANVLRQVQMGFSDLRIEPGKEREVEEIRFALRASFNYIFQVQREDAIFERLKATRPDVAVVGMAHGDQIMMLPELVDELDVAEYWQGFVPEFQASFHNLDHLAIIPRQQYLEPGEPDPFLVAEREQAIRWHNAVSLGRITTGERPAFIGSWRPDCRPDGLFEVHVEQRNGNNVRGTIIDALGTAHFTGEVTDERIRLEKEYDPAQVLTTSYISGPIVQAAEADADGLYTGEWYAVDRPSSYRGELIIKQSDKLYDPPLAELEI